jgi:hypothetical protein
MAGTANTNRHFHTGSRILLLFMSAGCHRILPLPLCLADPAKRGEGFILAEKANRSPTGGSPAPYQNRRFFFRVVQKLRFLNNSLTSKIYFRIAAARFQRPPHWYFPASSPPRLRPGFLHWTCNRILFPPGFFAAPVSAGQPPDTAHLIKYPPGIEHKLKSIFS